MWARYIANKFLTPSPVFQFEKNLNKNWLRISFQKRKQNKHIIEAIKNSLNAPVKNISQTAVALSAKSNISPLQLPGFIGLYAKLINDLDDYESDYEYKLIWKLKG